MGWETSDRRSRLPKDWHARRAATKKRAHSRCQHIDPQDGRCTWTSPPARTGQPDGHVDHINRDAGDEQTNLQWLCPTHHKAKTASEGHDAMRQRRTQTRHRVEQHPGFN